VPLLYVDILLLDASQTIQSVRNSVGNYNPPKKLFEVQRRSVREHKTTQEKPQRMTHVPVKKQTFENRYSRVDENNVFVVKRYSMPKVTFLSSKFKSHKKQSNDNYIDYAGNTMLRMARNKLIAESDMYKKILLNKNKGSNM